MATGHEPTRAAGPGPQAPSPEARAQQALAAVRRRGLRQQDALQALMAKLAPEAADIPTAARAADRAARFALTEGWVTGPLWVAYGAQFVLSRWAIEHGVSLADVRTALGQSTDAAGDSSPASEEAS